MESKTRPRRTLITQRNNSMADCCKCGKQGAGGHKGADCPVAVNTNTGSGTRKRMCYKCQEKGHCADITQPSGIRSFCKMICQEILDREEKEGKDEEWSFIGIAKALSWKNDDDSCPYAPELVGKKIDDDKTI
jgi:hypothetical protein